MTAAEEAKHLSSVTDHVQEQELDASKASEAMTALAMKPSREGSSRTTGHLSVPNKKKKVSKDDVALIVSELEVTEDVAEKALRDVLEERGEEEEEEMNRGSIVGEALRRLIVS